MNIDFREEGIKSIFGNGLFIIVSLATVYLAKNYLVKFAVFDYYSLAMLVILSSVSIIFSIRIRTSDKIVTYSMIANFLILLIFVGYSFIGVHPDKANMTILVSMVAIMAVDVNVIQVLLTNRAIENSQIAGLGYATTGVLYCNSNPTDPQFILVYNKNLRDGLGLWVPPGGHFLPHSESPESNLRQKIQSELGVAVDVVSTTQVGTNLDISSLTTESTAWLTPPAFLLKENLHGRCSNNHLYHLDFVYICRTNGKLVGSSYKYKASQQLRIPLSKCLNSYNDAAEAVYLAIDEWETQVHGAMHGKRDSVTNDVIWRLHIAAINLNHKNSTPLKRGV